MRLNALSALFAWARRQCGGLRGCFSLGRNLAYRPPSQLRVQVAATTVKRWQQISSKIPTLTSVVQKATGVCSAVCFCLPQLVDRVMTCSGVRRLLSLATMRMLGWSLSSRAQSPTPTKAA